MQDDNRELANQAFVESLSGPEAAEEAIEVLTDLGDEEQFAAITADVLRHHSDDARILYKLGLGQERLGMLTEAKATLEEAMRLEPTTETREALARVDRTRLQGARPPASRLKRWWPVWTLAGALVALLLWHTALAILVRPRHVYLVNGLDRGYSVQINDLVVEVPAHGRRKLDVEYGTLSVRPAGHDPLPLPPMDFVVDASLVDRTISKLVYIINPDRCACLWQVTSLYEQENSWVARDSGELFVGKAFYAFRDVDHPFSDSPGSLDRPDDGQPTLASRRVEGTQEPPVRRVALLQISEDGLAGRASVIRERLGDKTAAQYCANVIDLTPSSPSIFDWITTELSVEAAISILQPHLSRRPVEVPSHRAFQDLMRRKGDPLDLQARYQALLDEDPQNPKLMYLLGRLFDDPERSMGLFQKATQGEPPEPWAWYAISVMQTARGRFEKALEAISHARKQEPANEWFESDYVDLLKANQRWSDLITYCRSRMDPASPNWNKTRKLVSALAAAKDLEGADREIDRWAGQMVDLEGPGISTADLAQGVAALTAARAMWGDDPVHFSECARKVDASTWQRVAALAEGNAPAACALFDRVTSGVVDPYTRLGLHALALSQRNKSLADQQLLLALARLREEHSDSRLVAGWFAEGAPAPTLEETWRVCIGPARRKLLLVALALHHPSSRRMFLERAARFNYDHDPWYFPVTRIVRSMR